MLGTKDYLRVLFDKSVISRLVPLTPDTSRAIPVTLQVSLPSRDRLIQSGYDPLPVHNRTMSNISNESASSLLTGHNQIPCTPLSDADRSSIKSQKLSSKNSYQRNTTVNSPMIGEGKKFNSANLASQVMFWISIVEKSVVSKSLKRFSRGRSDSLTRAVAKPIQPRTPELSTLEKNKRTRSTTNIKKSSQKGTPTSASITNLLDEATDVSASRESLDSLGRDGQLGYVVRYSTSMNRFILLI